jgi:nicotinamidase-related amidase
MNEALVIIDPQNDFCDRRGSLYVEGAEEDILRLSRYIGEKSAEIGVIFVSLDSHDGVAIFHQAFWLEGGGQGGHPAPFTQISSADLKSGRWKAASPANEPFAARTLDVMDARGLGAVTVWPEHCVVSTWGHQIASPLQDALGEWRKAAGLAVRYVFKGETPYTDQFSVFEGVDDSYPETSFNETLFERLSAFRQVTFAGEALSHCVQESILSYVRRLKKNGAGQGAQNTQNTQSTQNAQKIRLLTDCTSPVGGFDRDASLRLLRESGIELL